MRAVFAAGNCVLRRGHRDSRVLGLSSLEGNVGSWRNTCIRRSPVCDSGLVSVYLTGVVDHVPLLGKKDNLVLGSDWASICFGNSGDGVGGGGGNTSSSSEHRTNVESCTLIIITHLVNSVLQIDAGGCYMVLSESQSDRWRRFVPSANSGHFSPKAMPPNSQRL